MANVNAPAHLEAFAAEHHLDLTAYSEAVADLKKITWTGRDGATKKFIDVETPFAEHVLGLLRTGASMPDAIASATYEALEARSG